MSGPEPAPAAGPGDLALLAVSALIAGNWLVRAARRKEWDELGPVPWGAELAIAAVALMLVGGTLAGGGLLAWGLDFAADPLPFVVTDTAIKLLVVAAVWVQLDRACGEPVRTALGLRPVQLGRIVATSVAGYAGLWAPILLATLAVMQVSSLAGLTPEEQPLIDAVRRQSEAWPVGAVAVAALVFAPLIEEFLFRGVLYRALRNGAGRPWLPMLGSSVIFAALHFHPYTFLPLVVLGVGLSAVYEAAGTLWAPLLVHAAFNATQFAALLREMADSAPLAAASLCCHR